MSTGEAGSATGDPGNSPSFAQLYDTFIPVFIVAVITVAVFLVLRRILTRNYAPRTFLKSLRPQYVSERSPDLPNGLFNWIGKFNQIPDTYVLNHQSLDGFLLLRYLKISSAICLIGCFITMPILFPVNITGGGPNQQLDLLSFGNVVNKNRYYAHTFVAWIFCSFVMYMVTRESIYYINLRQAYLLSPLYAGRMSSRTVLFTSVPEEYLDETKLRRMYGKQVKNLWIANECEKIEETVKERDKVAMKLEAAETKLVKIANAARLKSIKKGGEPQGGSTLDNDGDGESGSVAARWIQPKQRPTHRLKPIIGKKVDTINWCRSELERLIPKITSMQARYRAGEAKFIPSVFIEFYTQSDAQSAYQSLAHHQPLHMSPRFIGINPEEVIWKNLKINWASRVVRNIATTAFVIQVFLITTVSSSAAAAGAEIYHHPDMATSLLAQNLPKASNFYISYFILQGLTISSKAVLQIVGVILFLILGKFLDNTPRKIFKRWSSLSGLSWGTVFPVYTNLTVIAITYSTIAPLVLGFATVGLYLIYLAYRYNLLFVFGCDIDTKGLVYPRALQQTTTGVYLSILCLIGLLAIRTAIGPLILMIVFLVFMVLFHVSLNSAIDPLLKYLPKSLEAEEESLLALEDGKSNGNQMVDEKGTHVAAQSTLGRSSDTSTGHDLPAPPQKKPNLLSKWLFPHKYTDYHTLRRLVPRGFAEITYDEITERDAYYHPAIASYTPTLWIPRDQMGVSKQECRHSSKIIPMTDQCAHFDDKNKLVWDQDSGNPPIYEEKVYY
ncbi:MAG: hypothetical protein Q9195_006410 [Heterodermia aff. obscurata]